MFGQLLHHARTTAHLSIAELATRAGTSRAAITAYEHDTRTPTINTAGRILDTVGYTLTTAHHPTTTHTFLNPDTTTPLDTLTPDHERATRYATRMLPVTIEALLAAEHITLTWGTITTRVTDNITVAGPTRDIDRLNQLTTLAHHHTTTPPRLDTTSPLGTHIHIPDTSLPPRGAFAFLALALTEWADPAETLLHVNGWLTSHGYPILTPNYTHIDDWNRAIVATRRTADATPLAKHLIGNINWNLWEIV